MVPHNTVIAPTAQLEKNVIKVATKQHKDKLYFKRESKYTSNKIESKTGTRNTQNIVTPERQTPSTRLRDEEKPKNHKTQFLRSNKMIFYHGYGIILLYIIVVPLV